VTLTGDYTHEDQSGLPNTVLGIFNSNQKNYIGPNDTIPGTPVPLLFVGTLMGNMYHMCISTPASALTTGPFNTTNGLCGPLGQGTWDSTAGKFRGNGFTGGVPAIGGSGAVGVPNSVLKGLASTYGATNNGDGTYTLPSGGVITLGNDRFGGSVIYPNKTPRLYMDMQNTVAPGKDKTFSNGPSFARYNAWGTSVTFDWHIRDNMELKSITGWRGIKWDIGTDLDGMPSSMQEVTDEQKQWQVSQELQLTGKAFNDRLDYVAGLYYFTENGYVHDFVPFNTAYLWIYDFRNNVHTDSYAGYVHLDYRVTSRIGLTFGARYSLERKKFEGGQADLNGFSYKITGCNDPADLASNYTGTFVPWSVIFAGTPVTCQQALGFPDPNNPLRYFPPGFDHQSWNVFTPTGGIQYHFSDDLMVYASYSEGFKSGGWTTRLSDPISDSAAARFNPEHDKTYEIGLKSQWFENRLWANIAGFYSQYNGIQINVQEGPSPVYQLAVNAGYMDAYYSKLEPCLLYVGCDPANGPAYDPNFGGFVNGALSKTLGVPKTKLPKTPKYKINVNPSYLFNLATGSTVLLTADYTRTAAMENNAPNTPLMRRPATDMVNASIHWTPAGGKYQLAAGVTNLTNSRYLHVTSDNLAAGEIVGSYNAPRMWYLTARVDFK
ncbi:MAG: TonB-dependent receptor, partial [Acidobacteriota bacterium]